MEYTLALIDEGLLNKSGYKTPDPITVLVKNKLPADMKPMALQVKMPSGLELINPRLYGTELDITSDNLDYQDYRDDRVNTFFHIQVQKQVIFKFKARAAYKGDFYWPAISCEHMYRGDVNVRTNSRRIQVE